VPPGQSPRPSGRRSPVVRKHFRLLGRPFQGTHRLGNWQSDRAYDLGVPEGTEVYAPYEGLIGARVGALAHGAGRFAGKRVYLEVYANGYDRPMTQSYYFAHLRELAPGVRPGARLAAGDLLGYTGSASGVPHLHVAVMRGDPASKLLRPLGAR
jgi:murein DD-endopeptidase MepM/ murein hydrolase activator NlpD